MKILTATILLAVLVMSIVGLSQSYATHENHSSLKMELEKSTYLVGETVQLSGVVAPLRENVPVVIDVLDPSGNVYLAIRTVPEANVVKIGSYSYKFTLLDDIPLGIWSVSAKYASEYNLYGKTDVSFRVSDTINIISTPSLKVVIDGLIESTPGEWAYKYDAKEWNPFVHDPREIEGSIAFNAYYINGILYAVFDVPDKKFDSRDFVELGIDINGVVDNFKTGDEVYIFRVFRDGTYESFRLGTEHLGKENLVKYHFTAKPAEAGDMRLQVFDENGNFLKTFDSLRSTSSTSFKGMLGIAGIEVDKQGNLFLLDSDSGVIIKFDSAGEFRGNFGSLGTDLKEFIDPTGIALDPEGNIYVADTGNARVQKFDRHGGFVGAFGSMGILSVGMMQLGESEENKRHDLFKSPEGIVVDSSGNVYVVDRKAGNVGKFESDGSYIESFGSMVDPVSIAEDSQGNIYIVEQGNNRVIKSDKEGNILKMWGAFGIDDGTFKTPYGIGIDSGDNVYVSDSVNHRIQKFDSNGNFIAKWGTQGKGIGEFNGPHGLAVDFSDNIYVADASNYRIQKFDSNGNFLTEWGIRGSSPGDFNRPEDVATDSHGSIYVTDIYNKRVQKFSGDGKFLLEWGTGGVGDGEFMGPFGIAIDLADNVYVADPLNRRVQKFDTGGNLLLRWGSGEVKEAVSIEDISQGAHYIAMETNSHEPIGLIDAKLVEEQGRGSYFIEGGTIWKILHIFKDTVYVQSVDYVRNEEPVLSWTPDGIEVDSYGNVYIVDRENEVAKKFDNEGRLISKWGSTGAGDSEFSKPTAMSIDSENNVYIVDTGNNRIQKFDSDGNFIIDWGTFGEEPSQFNDARGIAIDSQDNVYVLDKGNNRIQKFDSDGNFITQWGSKGSSIGQFDNLSTEGIAVDSEGRVYVADLPGEAKVSHWIAEVAIPLFIESDTFGIFLAEGTYGELQAQDDTKSTAINIYNVYKNTWPAGAISVLPETWAKAKLTDVEKIKAETSIIIDNVRSCTNELCSNVDEFKKPVLTGNSVIVTASIVVEGASDKFISDGTKVTLQYSFDEEEWIDADSKIVRLSKEVPAAANLKWTPMESGDVKLRVTSSGILTKESKTDPMSLTVQESESFKIRANVKWSTDRIMQDDRITFEIGFTGPDNKILESLNYDLRIIEDGKTVADLSLLHTQDGKDVYKYRFKQPGLHILQVRINAIGSTDDFIPMKKVFNYKIDVLPVDTPLKVTTVQKGESMKIKIKNRDMGNLRLNSITFSLSNIDNIKFKLPESWTSSVNTESMLIQFNTENDPLTAGESVEFIIKSKALTNSLYSVCWDLEQSTLVVKVC